MILSACIISCNNCKIWAWNNHQLEVSIYDNESWHPWSRFPWAQEEVWSDSWFCQLVSSPAAAAGYGIGRMNSLWQWRHSCIGADFPELKKQYGQTEDAMLISSTATSARFGLCKVYNWKLISVTTMKTSLEQISLSAKEVRSDWWFCQLVLSPASAAWYGLGRIYNWNTYSGS